MKYLYKYPQAAFPYEQLLAREPPAHARRSGIRAARYRRLRRKPLLRRLRGIRQGGARRYPDPHHSLQPRAGSRRRWTCCPPSGSAIPGPGERGPRDRDRACGAAARASAGGARASRTTASAGCTADGDAGMLFTENETNRQALWDIANASPYIKDGIARYVVHGETGRGQSRAARHQGRRALLVHAGARRLRAHLQLRLADQRLDDRLRRGFRPDLRRPHPGSRRVLRRRHARPSFPRTRAP